MAAPQYQLSMRSGPEPGQVFPLDQDEVRLGRDLGNDITISDPEVSRHHVRLLKREESVYLEDLGSTNGTFLNGERISNPQQLRVGDVITLGDKIVMDFEKVPVEQEATLVSDYEVVVPEARSLEPESVQMEPEEIVYPVEEQEAAPEVEPEAVPEIVPEPELEYQAAASKEPRTSRRVKEKKDGLPTWLIILIIAIVVLACVIAVTLYFMPASWWCAITFDMLEGCPVP